jgi:hypothetical protein
MSPDSPLLSRQHVALSSPTKPPANSVYFRSNMLSSLPTELLREIIESSVTHTFHSRTYNDRQHTLCSLSLVSKLFRSIAQPLLLEIVQVDSRDRIEKLPDLRRSSRTRRFVYISRPGKDASLAAERLSTLLWNFRNLRSLTICRFTQDPLKLDLLSEFPSESPSASFYPGNS